jgi:hypothetical protein
MKDWKRTILDNANRIPQIYGLLIFIGLIVYFFTMYALGLVHFTGLRAGNMLFLTAGVYLAMKQFQRTHRGHMDYFHAFTTGMWTAAIGTLMFSAFLLLYMHVDQHFMNMLAAKHPLGFYLNAYIASFIVSLEGVFSGLFVTYLLANFLADRRPARPMRDHSEIIQ